MLNDIFYTFFTGTKFKDKINHSYCSRMTLFLTFFHRHQGNEKHHSSSPPLCPQTNTKTTECEANKESEKTSKDSPSSGATEKDAVAPSEGKGKPLSLGPIMRTKPIKSVELLQAQKRRYQRHLRQLQQTHFKQTLGESTTLKERKESF